MEPRVQSYDAMKYAQNYWDLGKNQPLPGSQRDGAVRDDEIRDRRGRVWLAGSGGSDPPRVDPDGAAGDETSGWQSSPELVAGDAPVTGEVGRTRGRAGTTIMLDASGRAARASRQPSSGGGDGREKGRSGA